MAAEPDSAMDAATLRERHKVLTSFVGSRSELVIGTVREHDFVRFALACRDDDPRYTDAEAARSVGYPGTIAHPLFLSAVTEWDAGRSQETLRADGTSGAEIANLPLEGLRVMGGGQELEFGEPVVDGTHVTVHTTVESVDYKTGRSGPLLVIGVVRTFVDAEDRLLVQCRESFIAR